MDENKETVEFEGDIITISFRDSILARRKESQVEEQNKIATQELVADNLQTLLNVMGCDTFAMRAKIMKWHRTLQQILFSKFIVPLIKDFAKLDDRLIDGRNEATARLCRVIVNRCKDELDNLPLI